jgi:hypothetical protein
MCCSDVTPKLSIREDNPGLLMLKDSGGGLRSGKLRAELGVLKDELSTLVLKDALLALRSLDIELFSAKGLLSGGEIGLVADRSDRRCQRCLCDSGEVESLLRRNGGSKLSVSILHHLDLSLSDAELLQGSVYLSAVVTEGNRQN